MMRLFKNKRQQQIHNNERNLFFSAVNCDFFLPSFVPSPSFPSSACTLVLYLQLTRRKYFFVQQIPDLRKGTGRKNCDTTALEAIPQRLHQKRLPANLAPSFLPSVQFMFHLSLIAASSSLFRGFFFVSRK